VPRPKKPRRVAASPTVRYFKPQGVPLRELTEVYLSMEGLEAVRLVDLEGATASEAATSMGVSRHTLGRILAEARQTLARAVVNGQALRVQEGDAPLLLSDRTARPCTPVGSTVHVTPPSGSVGGDTHKEITMRHIAITSAASDMNSQVDGRFGRAPGFAIVDEESGEATFLDNDAAQSMGQGAGIQAAQALSRAGVRAVLTGFVGPKAFRALEAAGIAVYQDMDGLTLAEALERYRSGGLARADVPNREAGSNKGAGGGQGRGGGGGMGRGGGRR